MVRRSAPSGGKSKVGSPPSTIAAEIAGLVAAAAIAGPSMATPPSARIYRATADHYQRNIKGWTVTSNGPFEHRPRTSSGSRSPAIRTPPSPTTSATAVRTLTSARSSTPASSNCHGWASFPPATPTLRTRCALVDQVISRQTSSGTGFYRYGTTAVGTEDGYGDCDTARQPPTARSKASHGQVSCNAQAQNHGSGHLWPASDPPSAVSTSS